MAGLEWRLIASLLRPHRRAFVAFGFVLGVATAVPILSAVVMAEFIQRVVDGAPAERLVRLGLAYAGLGLIASALSITVAWRATALAWQLTNGLRHDLASYVLHADLSFHRDRTPGELLTRCDGDITSLNKFLALVVSRLVGITAVALTSLVVMLFLEPLLAIPLVFGHVALGVTLWKMRNASTEATAAERTSEADTMGVLEQYLAGAEDVATLGAGAHGVRRFADHATIWVQRVGRRVRAEMATQASVRSIIGLWEGSIIAIGAVLVARGRLDVGGVVLGFRFAGAVRAPTEHLLWRLQESQGVGGAARRVLELLADHRRIESGTAVLPDGPIDVSFEHVGLVYDDAEEDEAALRDLNLTIPAGRVVGLVGRTGSGKTTVARLMLRLVDPTSGVVTFGGVDTRLANDERFRLRVCAVPQDVQLFPGTVRDNVTMFADADDDRVIQALNDVGLGGWLDAVPNGLDSVLSPDGRNDENDEQVGLSSGQAQLLSTARALLRQPDVVVLDEATSRVDPATQDAIAAATARLISGRTAVIIAHRLETLDVCDDIAVLADGTLIEYGSRAALGADETSHYARLRAAGERAEELA